MGDSEYQASILVSLVDSVVYPIDHHLVSFLQKPRDCSQTDYVVDVNLKA